ncbi:hypothetical protein [Bauldia sp.]|uniref:hypothetical protein n=1 Tax=Bauldia sp. TaxID=2575872 RepID=UPI003BA86895
MSQLVDDLTALSAVPGDSSEFDDWLNLSDAMAFLKKNALSDEIVIYAVVPSAFIHGVLAPRGPIVSPDIDDLLAWSGNPASSWGIVHSADTVEIQPPLSDYGSKTLAAGEQIIFSRSLPDVPQRGDYIEISQALSHLAGLHYIAERDAWCRLNRHGDLVDMLRVVHLPPSQGQSWGGTAVVIKARVLEAYATLQDAGLVRMFDFSRHRPGTLPKWGAQSEIRRLQSDLHYRFALVQGQASYARGVQISFFDMTRESAARLLAGGGPAASRQYATFIAHDWRHDRVQEICCSPGSLANYFVESDLPYEMSPAFFRPEVLLKYKSDREKYKLNERSVSCRGAWHLRTFDVNDAGQVHTYLGYLGQLPYEEQLHWKQYNEWPRSPISKRARLTDFEGEFFLGESNPLQELKNTLSNMDRRRVPWWTCRSNDLIEKSNYPFTTSPEEWAEEVLILDQLVVEGFSERWLRKRATELGRSPRAQFRSLKLVEECLVGMDFEDDHASHIVRPLHDLHGLRNKLKGHASGQSAQSIKSSVLAQHKSYRDHFRHLAGECNEAIGIIDEAFSSSTPDSDEQRSDDG